MLCHCRNPVCFKIFFFMLKGHDSKLKLSFQTNSTILNGTAFLALMAVGSWVKHRTIACIVKESRDTTQPIKSDVVISIVIQVKRTCRGEKRLETTVRESERKKIN